MCREWLCNLLCTDRSIPKPDIVKQIDWQELYSLLKSEFPDIPILLPDEYYQLATTESFKEFLRADGTDKYTYTGDPGFDCDDYASVLHGNVSIPKWSTVPIGTCWLSTPAHALNIFVDENTEVWLVEPQTDELFKISDRSGWKAEIIWF